MSVIPLNLYIPYSSVLHEKLGAEVIMSSPFQNKKIVDITYWIRLAA